MKLLEFYNEVVKSLGLTTTDDGFIKIGNQTLTINGVPFVMPTKEHIDSALDVNESGELELVKLPYNPLNENVIKGDTKSLRKTKDIVEKRLGHALAIIGELLLTLAYDSKLQAKTSMILNKFLSSIGPVKTKSMKDLVDDKTIDKWTKIYTRSIEPGSETSFCKVFIKKIGKINGTKYNRTTVIDFPILEAMENLDASTPIMGVTLRTKDIKVFNIMLKYVLNMLNEKGTVEIGDNDTQSPGFVTLFKAYILVATRLDKMLTALKFIDEEAVNSSKLGITLTTNDIDDVDKYAGELALIPSELDLNRSKARKAVKEHTQLNTTTGQVVPQQGQSIQQQEEEMDPVDKILYGGNVPPQPQMVPVQQQVQYQQPVIPQPVQQQPIAQQPAYQYQQPVQQQPIQQVQPMGVNGLLAQRQQEIQHQQYQQHYQQQYQQQPMGMYTPNVR